ncbi:MAG: hypothetical protein WC457_02365 [Patescibacteria group bacterium]
MENRVYFLLGEIPCRITAGAATTCAVVDISLLKIGGIAPTARAADQAAITEGQFLGVMDRGRALSVDELNMIKELSRNERLVSARVLNAVVAEKAGIERVV